MLSTGAPLTEHSTHPRTHSPSMVLLEAIEPGAHEWSTQDLGSVLPYRAGSVRVATFYCFPDPGFTFFPFSLFHFLIKNTFFIISTFDYNFESENETHVMQ